MLAFFDANDDNDFKFTRLKASYVNSKNAEILTVWQLIIRPREIFRARSMEPSDKRIGLDYRRYVISEHRNHKLAAIVYASAREPNLFR
jgi:hypothetical protein